MSQQRKVYASPRQLERRARVLVTAREQISLLGYDGLTMRTLAEASGVALKTLYNLFASKDELLLAAVADLLDDIRTRVEASAAAPGVDSIIGFAEVVSAQIVSTPAYAQAMASGLYQAEAGDNLVKVLLESTERYNRKALYAAQQAGELTREVDIPHTAVLIVAQHWGLVLAWSKGILALEDLPRAFLTTLLALLTPVTRGKSHKRVKERLAQL